MYGELIYPKSSGIYFPLLARTASFIPDENSKLDGLGGAILTNQGARGIHVVIDVTAIADSPSMVVTIEGYDVASGKWYTILASAAIVGTGTTVLRVYPGLAASSNVIADDSLPKIFRIKAVNADADSITYSIGFSALY